MKSSSPLQAELDFGNSGGAAVDGGGVVGAPVGGGAREQGSLAVPDFGAANPTIAITARLAGRLNASAVSEEEYLDLHRERQNLLDKKFANAMSRHDELRLEYVRWTLDRIEDARHGVILDELETSVGRLEQLQNDIRLLEERILEQLEEKTNESRRRPARRTRK